MDGFCLTGYFDLLSKKEKGLDAFCDKICSKIRESRFCVAMLNDPVIKSHNDQTRNTSEIIRAPRANVYYELGMAITLEKSVIPVIRKGFELPFDDQSLDSIVYEDLADLEEQLKSSILPTLLKKKKEFKTNDSKQVDQIYDPLYAEFALHISKKDRFTPYRSSTYQRIRNQYQFALIKKDLQEEIKLFYAKIEEFNARIHRAERIIREISVKQISSFFKIPHNRSLSISVNLETDDGQSSPNLNQILIRGTTPELYYETQGIIKWIKKITYSINNPNHDRYEFDSETFKTFFDKCKKAIESNEDIIDMRELEEQLRINGEGLKKKSLQLCTQ